MYKTLSHFVYKVKKTRKKNVDNKEGDNIISRYKEFDYEEDFKTYSNNEKDKKFNIHVHDNLEIVLKQNNISNSDVKLIILPGVNKIKQVSELIN
ncbi:MAG: hypothetical protein U9Q66_03330 [Patescibacteria group bacterium]|nr:hypothetical protein [Patescibacteria group bacterium]